MKALSFGLMFVAGSSITGACMCVWKHDMDDAIGLFVVTVIFIIFGLLVQEWD